MGYGPYQRIWYDIVQIRAAHAVSGIVVPRLFKPMKTISTTSAPAAIGPYSQAKIAGQFLFTAGQIPLDAATGEISGKTIEEQTEVVLRNLQAILEAAGCSWIDVVKTTVFLVDLGDFAKMNAVYEKYLGETKPARSTVQVAALPRSARVEIELIAEISDRNSA